MPYLCGSARVTYHRFSQFLDWNMLEHLGFRGVRRHLCHYVVAYPLYVSFCHHIPSPLDLRMYLWLTHLDSSGP